MTRTDLTAYFAIALCVLCSCFILIGDRITRAEERRIGVLLWVGAFGLLGMLLTGCCDPGELVADDQTVAPPCELGLLNAALQTDLTVPNVTPFCESVGEGDACAVVCAVHGRGLICDADGCEEHERP